MDSIFEFIGAILKLVTFLVIVVGIIALIGYNSLRSLSESVKEAFSNIGVTSRKQVSLTNQLIDTVKGYADTEQFIQLKVSSDLTAASLAALQQESGMVVSAISGLAQRFPDLKSNQQYAMLMNAIRDIEDQLERQRERYNAAAKEYNVKRMSIPHVFYAGALGFQNAPYLDLAAPELQDMGMLRTISNDDGERIKELLGAAGSRTTDLIRSASSKALEHGKAAASAAQEKLKQLQTERYTWLDQDRNPRGPDDMATLRQHYADGLVNDDTSVMPAGGQAWMRFADVVAAESVPENS